MKKISIIIPCYNEAENLAPIVERYASIAEKYNIELIAVNNGSTDTTGKILDEFALKYNFLKVVSVKNNVGYGHGIISGIKEASGAVLAWTHSDMQTDPEDIIVAYEAYENRGGNVLIKGRRLGRGIIDVIFTFGMSVIATLILQKKVTDINAQPKLFDRKFLSLLKDPPNDFSLDVYCLYVAKKHNVPIIEIPVKFRKRIHGVSKSAPNLIKKFQFSLATLKAIIKLRLSK